MNARSLSLTVGFFACFTAIAASHTINWGKPLDKVLVDSNGDAVDDTYVFELGAFALNYDPQVLDVGEWLTHWRVFDSLVYSPPIGFSTSTVAILNGVFSGSTRPNVSTESFAGLDAYIWVRKGDNPQPGSEWFLARALDWTFPTTGGDCCPGITLEWSVSDFGPGEVPNWGRQNDLPGPGERTQDVTINGIQTHTFIPEPSSALLAALGGLALLRRRRNA